MSPTPDRTLPSSAPVFLFDLDKTLLTSRTVLHLADRFDVREDLEAIWDKHRGELAAGERETLEVARLFEGVPLDAFRQAVHEVPFREGAQGAVDALHQLGFQVGVASASYGLATERARRELGLDFSIGVPLEREAGRLTGRVLDGRVHGACGQWICKASVLEAWASRVNAPMTAALGDGANDACMARQADLGLALDPCHPTLEEAACRVVEDLSSVPSVAETFLHAHMRRG